MTDQKNRANATRPVGDAEKYVGKSENIGFAVQVVPASIVFFAGLFAFGTALGLRGRGP